MIRKKQIKSTLSKIAFKTRAITLPIRSAIADQCLPSKKGTIITGSVRSGTSLALCVFCPDLTREEVQAGSKFQEPQPLSGLIVNGDIEKALLNLPLALQNRQLLIKLPHIAFLLPSIEPKYEVIVTFRDLRMIIPSMLRHPNVRRLDLSDKPYWSNYVDVDVPADPILSAIVAARQYYENIAAYGGAMEVWNYGFWDEWNVRNQNISHLYPNQIDASESVQRDVERGNLFSNSTFGKRVWDKFCTEFTVTKAQEHAVPEANESIRELYRTRGHELKMLEDLERLF